MRYIAIVSCLWLSLAATYGQSDEATSRSLAEEQLVAYNARNINDFLRPYSDSVSVYNFPRELSYQGKDIMRERYSKLFKDYPELHCELVNRMVLGNKVIDHEKVIINKGEPPLKAIAIYTIRDGKIAEVIFMYPEVK